MGIRVAVSLAAVACAASLGLAGSALASSGGPVAVAAHGAPGGRASRGSSASTSSIFAGYQASTSGFTRENVTSTFVVPAVKNCGSTNRAIVPFVGGNSQSGFAGAGLLVACLNGKTRYFPIFQADGQLKKYASARARPGDRIVLRENWSAKKVFLSVADTTRPGVSKTLTGSGTTSLTNAEIGDSPYDSVSRVPNFGKVSFSNSKLNGHAFGLAPDLERFNMVNGSMTLQIRTSRLAGDKESFTTVFKHP